MRRAQMFSTLGNVGAVAAPLAGAGIGALLGIPGGPGGSLVGAQIGGLLGGLGGAASGKLGQMAGESQSRGVEDAATSEQAALMQALQMLQGL